MDPTAPTPDEVRAQLARILSAAPLANAGRLSRLLTYVVERTLAGEGDQLKEYVLGTEVFDRAGDYDPRLDSIVRVEARRLRAKLEEYYLGPGAADPVIVAIPRGSYVPTFARAATPTPALAVALPEAVPVRSTPSLRFFVVGAFLAGIITVVIAAGLYSRQGPGTAAAASSGPSIAVLPFHHYSTDPRDIELAARITDGVSAQLARLGTVSVASRTSAAQYTGETRPLREIAQALSVQYVLEANAVRIGDRVSVEARLVDAAIDRKVWVGEYDSAIGDIPALTRRIAADLAAAALARNDRR